MRQETVIRNWKTGLYLTSFDSPLDWTQNKSNAGVFADEQELYERLYVLNKISRCKYIEIVPVYNISEAYKFDEIQS